MPGRRRRTIAIAQRIPNAVFSGTVIAVTSAVSFSAATAVGLETADQNGCQPCSNARQKMSATGATSSAPRYVSELSLTIMARRPPPETADAEQHGERRDEHQQRETGRAAVVAGVEVLEDVE